MSNTSAASSKSSAWAVMVVFFGLTNCSYCFAEESPKQRVRQIKTPKVVFHQLAAKGEFNIGFFDGELQHLKRIIDSNRRVAIAMKGEPFMANPEFRNNLDENEVLKSSWNATKNVAFDSGSDGNWLVLDASQQEASIAADIIVFDGSGVLSLDVHLQQTQPDAELQILRDKQPIATIRFDAIGTHHHEIKMSGLLNGMSNFEFKVAKAVIPVRLGRFHFRSVD